MTAAATETVDLDRLEVDVKENITKLREAAGRLSLDAISDAEVRAELDAVESDLAAAEAEFGRIELARAERERRDEVARQEAEEQRQAAALAEARRLQGERHAAAVKIDREAAKLMQSIATYFEACSAQDRALTEAGTMTSAEKNEILDRLQALERALGEMLHAQHAITGWVRLAATAPASAERLRQYVNTTEPMGDMFVGRRPLEQRKGDAA